MKILYKLIASALFLCILFTSCTKEESGSIAESDSEMATLAFGTFVNDLNKQMEYAKDHLSDFPECSDAVPSYVEVRLTGEGYTGPETIEIPLSDTPGDYDDDGIDEYFTLESDELELPAGDYQLTYFAVYDSADGLIWIAPSSSGSLGEYVDNSLPLDISLNAGTKKYVDVEVLCYDKRMVNEYGYLFFELETNLALDFCFFANFCDANERHFTAAYTVNIWYGVDDSGVSLYSGVGPEPMMNEGGEYYTEPVCFALPELPEGFDEDAPYVYYEATLSDWEENYGDVDPLMISGTLSYNDIMANFDGEENVDYEHLRFGCGDNGGEVGCDINDPEADCDEDTIPNGQDQCPGEDDRIDVDEDEIPDCIDDLIDSDGDGVADAEDNCPSTPNSDQEDSDQDGTGDACDEDFCNIDNPAEDCDNDTVPNGEDQCPGEDDTIDVDQDNIPDCIDDLIDSDGDGVADGTDECANTPAGAEVNEVGCPDTDGDGLFDNEDNCPNENPTVDEDGDGCEDMSGSDCEWNIVNPDNSSCFRATLNGSEDSFLQIEMNTGVPMLEIDEIVSAGTFGITLTDNGLEYTFDIGSATIPQYNIQVSDSSGGDVACSDQDDDNNIVEGSFTYPIFVRVAANICESN